MVYAFTLFTVIHTLLIHLPLPLLCCQKMIDPELESVTVESAERIERIREAKFTDDFHSEYAKMYS